MSYKDALTAANAALAADPRTIFVGYGLTHGRAMGTLKDVPAAQILETPVAENLMVGLALGLSLCGRLPVVFVERCDFLLNAMDAIVNHLDKIAQLSSNHAEGSAKAGPEFKPAVILRIVVGNKTKPLLTGPVHTQDFCNALEQMVGFRVVRLRYEDMLSAAFEQARTRQLAGQSTALFEYKDLF